MLTWSPRHIEVVRGDGHLGRWLGLPGVPQPADSRALMVCIAQKDPSPGVFSCREQAELPRALGNDNHLACCVACRVHVTSCFALW